MSENKFKESYGKVVKCVRTGFKECFTFAKTNKKVTVLIVISAIMLFTLIVTIAAL